MATYALFESASGYALFEASSMDEIGKDVASVQRTVTDLERFSKVVKLVAFFPFTSAEMASEQINAIAEGKATEDLGNFLRSNLPKVKAGKKPKFQLAVAEPKIGNSIHESLGIPCVCNDHVGELLRGIRLHFGRMVKGLTEANLRQAQLGLAHSYSRNKVQHNVAKSDTMIIQSISLLDTLDRDINTFIMRVREWYGWHFPELVKIVNDNYKYSRIALTIKDRNSLSEEGIPKMAEILGDDAKAREVYEAARSSMGQDVSDADLTNIENFAGKVIRLAEYRQRLSSYLYEKMHVVAPNLSALIGELVGARLISHAGSLANLAKYPASTVQILGAEKALFRALKTKGNTPKYGLIFHSTFIGRAGPRNKGRISRYLANKCSIAARIDCFADFTTSAFGEKLREQVEERLVFYAEGKAPRKNVDVMSEVAKSLKDTQTAEKEEEEGVDEAKKEKKKKKKEKKKKLKQSENEEEQAGREREDKEEKKKKKKRKRASEEEEEGGPAADGADATKEEEKKKKRKKEKASADGGTEQAQADKEAEEKGEKKKKKKKKAKADGEAA